MPRWNQKCKRFIGENTCARTEVRGPERTGKSSGHDAGLTPVKECKEREGQGGGRSALESQPKRPSAVGSEAKRLGLPIRCAHFLGHRDAFVRRYPPFPRAPSRKISACASQPEEREKRGNLVVWATVCVSAVDVEATSVFSLLSHPF